MATIDPRNASASPMPGIMQVQDFNEFAQKMELLHRVNAIAISIIAVISIRNDEPIVTYFSVPENLIRPYPEDDRELYQFLREKNGIPSTFQRPLDKETINECIHLTASLKAGKVSIINAKIAIFKRILEIPFDEPLMELFLAAIRSAHLQSQEQCSLQSLKSICKGPHLIQNLVAYTISVKYFLPKDLPEKGNPDLSRCHKLMYRNGPLPAHVPCLKNMPSWVREEYNSMLELT